eukprot:COSAG02_NODE_5092_length_4640_cov_3.630478_4_plen_84_part_00
MDIRSNVRCRPAVLLATAGEYTRALCLPACLPASPVMSYRPNANAEPQGCDQNRICITVKHALGTSCKGPSLVAVCGFDSSTW